MADGQSYRPSTNSNFTRYSTPTKVAGPSLGKAPAGDSTSPRIHLFEPLLPLRRLYLSFILCLVRRCASRVIFRPYSVCKRIRYEENKFEEILEISSCCLASKIFREETGKRNFGRGNLHSKFWQKNFISWIITVVRCRWRIVFWTEWKNKGLMTEYQGHVQKWFESFDRSLCKQCWRRRTKEKGKKNTLALYTDSFCRTREEVEKKKSSNSIEDYPLPW